MIGLRMLEPGAILEADFEGVAVRQESGHERGAGDESGTVGGGVGPAAPAVERAFAILAP